MSDLLEVFDIFTPAEKALVEKTEHLVDEYFLLGLSDLDMHIVNEACRSLILIVGGKAIERIASRGVILPAEVPAVEAPVMSRQQQIAAIKRTALEKLVYVQRENSGTAAGRTADGPSSENLATVLSGVSERTEEGPAQKK